MDIALSSTFGQGNFTTDKTGNINFTGGDYDFDGKFGAVGEFIDQGGLMGASKKLGEKIMIGLQPKAESQIILNLKMVVTLQKILKVNHTCWLTSHLKKQIS